MLVRARVCMRVWCERGAGGHRRAGVGACALTCVDVQEGWPEVIAKEIGVNFHKFLGPCLRHACVVWAAMYVWYGQRSMWVT